MIWFVIQMTYCIFVIFSAWLLLIRNNYHLAVVVKQEEASAATANVVGNIQFPSVAVIKNVIAERRDLGRISAAAQDDIISDLLACESASNPSTGA